MLMDRYAETMKAKMDEVLTTQRSAMERAAECIVEAVSKGKNVHVFDSGHIINSELINRAGGLALLKQLKYTFSVEDPVKERDRGSIAAEWTGIGKLVLSQSKAAAGDVLIMGSVSGRSFPLVDLALTAKEMGITLVVITALSYSSAVASEHPSGKRLFEIGDVVVDNCAPKCDAMLDVEGIENRFGPASGISAAFAMWCISAEIIEQLMKRGLEPTLFRSVNFPGGWENYHQMCKRYEELGR